MKKMLLPLAAALTVGLSPLSAETSLTQTKDVFDPFVEMQKMQQQMDRIFEQFHQRMRLDSNFAKFDTLGSRPAVDFEDKGDHYIVKANIPGADGQKINVTAQNGTLKIEATTQKSEEKKEESKEGKFIKHERFFGSYTRILSLPADADEGSIKTDYKDGVLTVTIAKKKS
jgi:HSP20 family protein